MVVLELVDARIGNLRLGVVDDRRSLIVRNIHPLRLEPQAAPRQMPESVAEESVQRPGVVDRHRRQNIAADLEHAGVKPQLARQFHRYRRVVEKPVEKRVVACKRNPLIVVVEIVRVVVRPHRHALYDGGIDLLRRTAPLLRRVAAEERVEHGGRVSFVLHELRHLARRKLHAEELVQQSKPQRQKIRLAAVAGQNLVLVAVELHEPVHEVPDFGNVGVKDVRSVKVNLYAGFGISLAAHIPADDRTPVHDKHPFAGFGKAARDGAPPYAGAGDYSINALHRQTLAPSGRSSLTPVPQLTDAPAPTLIQGIVALFAKNDAASPTFTPLAITAPGPRLTKSPSTAS